MIKNSHRFKNLDEELEKFRLNHPRSKLIEKIQKMSLAKNGITSKIDSLIKSLERAFEILLVQLNEIITS